MSLAQGDGMVMLEALRRDAAQYVPLGGWHRNLGFWIGATYRFGTWARALPRPVGLPLRAVHRLLRLPWSVLLHVRLDADHIGPGLCLIHPHSVMVSGGTVIGRDCLIFHEVTLGTNVDVDRGPTIGDGVKVFVGARVLGPITIGHGARIGANCVVTQSVAPMTVVAAAQVRQARRPTPDAPAGASDQPAAAAHSDDERPRETSR